MHAGHMRLKLVRCVVPRVPTSYMLAKLCNDLLELRKQVGMLQQVLVPAGDTVGIQLPSWGGCSITLLLMSQHNVPVPAVAP